MSEVPVLNSVVCMCVRPVISSGRFRSRHRFFFLWIPHFRSRLDFLFLRSYCYLARILLLLLLLLLLMLLLNIIDVINIIIIIISSS